MNGRLNPTCAALLPILLGAHQIANAEPTVPFVWAPPTANYFIRLDVSAIESTPAFAPLVQRLSGANPRYSTEVLGFFNREIGPFGDVAEAIPGRLRAYEFSATFNVSDPTVWSQADRPPITLVVVPEDDIAALGANLTGQRWSILSTASSGNVYTDTRRRLYVSTPSPSLIAINTDLRTVPPTVREDSDDLKLREPLSALLERPFFALAIFTDEDKAQLAALASEPPKESWAIAGLPEAIREIGALRHAALAARATQTAQLDVMLGFSDEPAAQRAAEALNRSIPALAALGRQQAGTDQQALAQIEYISSLRFSTHADTIRLSFDLPSEFFETVGDAIAAQLPTPSAETSDVAALLAEDPSAPIKIELLDLPADSDIEEPMPPRGDTRPPTPARQRGNTLGSMVGAIVTDSVEGASSHDSGDELDAEVLDAFAQSMIVPKYARRDFPIRQTADYEGVPFTLGEYRGKVVLVDYWATWCPPSREATPLLVDLRRKLRYSGFDIVGVSLDKDAKRAKAFAEANGLDWVHLCDEKGWDSSYSRQMQVSSIPCLVFLDKRGRVAAENVPPPLAEAVARRLLAEAD